jgi:cyclin H
MSQTKNWTFSSIASLLALRDEHHNTAIERVSASIEIESTLSGTPVSPTTTFVTSLEQSSITSFYSTKILDVCKVFKKKGYKAFEDPTIQSTAVSYFKRFYLLHSIMEYEMKHILIVVIYLAGKVENAAIPLEEFLLIIPSSPSIEVIRDLEFTVSEGLRFNYQA